MDFLVIGLGSMGKRRIRNLKALGEIDIAGFDPRADRRAEAAERYGITVCDTFDGARACGAGAWLVSTPPLTHFGYALDGLARGAHVFTEADLPDARIDQVIAERDRTGLVAVPSCTMRNHAGPVKIRELFREGAVGQPLLFTSHAGQHLADWHPWESYNDFYVSERETGAAREIVPYELVWLTELFGEVTSVACMRGNTGILDCDIDDHYALLLGFAGGVRGTLVVDALARPEVRAFRLVGTEGILEWDHGARMVKTRRNGDDGWRELPLEAGTIEAGYVNPEEPYIEEMRDFIAAIRGEKPFPTSYEEDAAILAVLLRAEAAEIAA